MARDKLTEYSATASENTVCGDVNIAENSALPSDLNNYAREIMTHLKNFSDGTDAIDALTVESSSSGEFNAVTISQANNTSGNESRIRFKRTTDGGSGREVAAIVADRRGGNDTDLVFETNTDGSDGSVERVRIQHDGNVGIGESSPADKIHSSGDIRLTSGASTTRRVYALAGGGAYSLNSSGGAAIAFHRDASNNDEIAFETHTQGSSHAERLRILAGGGITFNGDTAAANALDDYEEGTWTPQISATDGIGTLTYSGQVGHYTKIGNRVFFHMYVLINQKGTVAGDIRYTLPFSAASVTQLYTAVSIWMNSTVNGQDFDGDFNIQAYIGPGAGHVTPQALDGDGSVQGLTAGMVGNGTDVMIAGHYRI